MVECTSGSWVEDISHFPVIHRFRMAPFSRIAALKAWTRKYFKVASLPRDQVFSLSIGSKDKVLSSSPSHIGNQCFDSITSDVPSAKVARRNSLTVRFIGPKRSLTSLI